MRKIWTEERLTQMKDEFLANSKTLSEAVKKAQKKWKISFHIRNFQRAFVDRYGQGPADYLQRAEYAEPEQTAPSEMIASLVKSVRNGSKSLEELCNKLKLWPAQVRKLVDKAEAEGYSVRIIGDELHFTGLEPRSQPASITFPKIKQDIVFGVMSDTHVGSKYCRRQEITDYVETVYKHGVRDIFHAGDVMEGGKMYRGWELEVAVIGFEDQAQLVLDTFPQKPGLKYHFITGNHDLSFHKQSGQEPGEGLVAKAIASGRDDFNYLGPERALVYYGGKSENEGILIELIHPGGGGGYASSYKLQRIVAAMQGGTKPQFLFQGHEHQYVHINERNVHALKPGCFQSQTPYMLRKNLHPALGGLLCHVGVTKDFAIRTFSTEFISYYGEFHKPHSVERGK